MKTIHIKDYCAIPGNSQLKAASLIGIHQTAVSKIIRMRRPVFLEFTDEDEFIRCIDLPEPRLIGKKSA